MPREKKTRFVESPTKVQCNGEEPLKHRSLSPRSYEGRRGYAKSTPNIPNHDRASHTSVYFTPEPEIPANDKLSSKNRRKHRTKRIGIHIGRNSHNSRVEPGTMAPFYTRKGPQYYDPITHSDRRPGSSSESISSSNDESGDIARKKIVIYNPVKRSCSQESSGKYATQFKQRLADDRKCGAEMKVSVQKSPRKRTPVRKNVYRPIEKKDTCFQTDDHNSNVNKGCQASEEPIHKANCCRGEQCDLLKPNEIKTDQRDVAVGRDSGDNYVKQQNTNQNHNTGHIFPFVGMSPSGNLKITPEMVSFESKNVSLLVANPKRTRIRHKEYFGERLVEDPKSENLFEAEIDKPDTQCHANSCSKPKENHNNHHHKERGLRPRSKSCINAEKVSNDINLRKAQCHREHRSRHRKEDNQRNYTQEMKAWTASIPLFKPDGPSQPSVKLTHNDTIDEDIQPLEFKDNGRNSLTYANIEMSRILGGSGEKRKSRQGLLGDKLIPPPKVPPFPRETSPGGSSFITQSQPFTTDTEGESSYQTSNPAKVKIKNSRGTVDFMENLHYRVKRAIHPDTKVIIGNKEFPVHSVALQIHSKYFDNLKRPYEAVHMVELPESVISPDDFQHLMDWVLTDENDRKLVITRDNVIGLYSTAQYLVIPDLKAQCLKFVQEKVESEDPKLIKLWEEAHLKPKTKELIAVLSQKLTTLFPKLYKTRQFLKLDVNELVTLLDSPDVVIDSEMDIFDASVRWLLYDWSNRKRHTVKVMSTIRFGLLTPLQLTQMRYLSEDNDAPDFKKIFGFDSVKKMLEDGLTYAILKQSYGKRSGELNKWIRNTGVTPPKPRVHLDPELENQQRSPDLQFDVVKSVAFQAGKEVISQLKSLDLKSIDLDSLAKNVQENVEKAKKKISAMSKKGIVTENEAEPDKEFTKEKIDSPAKQSLLLLPDIPYSEHPSSQTIENEHSGESLDAEQKQNEIQAAITIQSQVRGYLARKKVEKMKNAATRIQTALRSFRTRTRNDYRPLKEPSGIRSLAPPDPASLPPYMIQNLDIPKDALLVFGGADPKLPIGPNNTGRDIYMYTVEANVWMHVGRMPEPRTHFGLARIDNEVYIVGGTDPRYKTSNERNIAVKGVWKSNLRHGEWSYDSESPKDLPNPRSHFGCVEKNGIIYVIGGNDVDSKALSTCEKYEKTYNSWTPIAALDGPRLSMGITVYNDHIWVAGGISKNMKMPVLKSVLCYDINSNRWTAARSLPLPRAFFTLVTVQDRLYILGGAGQREKKSTKQSSLPDVLLFDKDNEKWKEVAVLNTARHGHVAAAIGHNIIVLGGVNSAQMGAINSVEILDLTVSHARKGRSLRQNMSGMGVLPLN